MAAVRPAGESSDSRAVTAAGAEAEVAVGVEVGAIAEADGGRNARAAARRIGGAIARSRAVAAEAAAKTAITTAVSAPLSAVALHHRDEARAAAWLTAWFRNSFALSNVAFEISSCEFMKCEFGFESWSCVLGVNGRMQS
jgi:hypothetical protein